ncbi:MAG: sulfatase [Anaerorhabdus sp.]
MNILYLHTHDTGRVISPYGYPVHTPNYKSLSNDSLLFHNAFCASPTCSPSRSSLLCGVYPSQNGMLGLAQRGFDLKEEMHLSNILKNVGYHRVLCGVQHVVGYYTDHQAGANVFYDEDISADNSQYCEKDLVKWDIENARNLAKWLDNNKSNKNFFVSYGMHATHRAYPDVESIDIDQSVPLTNIPNTKESREDFAQFKQSLSIADECLGRVIASLKRNGYYDNTIIVCTTDHGLANPFEKCTLKDGGTGVLLMMRVPNTKLKSKSFDGLISHIDIVPTLLDLIKIKKPDYLEGKSFINLFNNNEYVENEFVYGEINFHTSYEPARSIRNKRYKYIKYFDKSYLKLNLSNIDDSIVKDMMMNCDHDLNDYKKSEEYLFDLMYDKFETNNLIDNLDYQQEKIFLKGKLEEHMKRVSDPLLINDLKILDKYKVNKRTSKSSRSKDLNDFDSLGIINRKGEN